MTDELKPREGMIEFNPPGILRAASKRGPTPTSIPCILPHEKVFPIQIGSELFRLSGASISSDAPSYFSSFFQCQVAAVDRQKAKGEEPSGIRTLYIDRDPVTFADISRHLQGYHIRPRDGSHFVKLFADAQFYQLPRLIDQLYEDSIYISIGGREFHVQRDLFTGPGDSPNYFTLGYAFLFSNPTEVFPGLDREGLLRPPSIMPPAIPKRSADVFAEILLMLKGYPVHIRNEEHRAHLLKDCKYFLFKGLEQKLLPHTISHNPLRNRDEITIRLTDIRQPGLSVAPDPANTPRPGGPAIPGWVNYARQYVDDTPYELIVEIGDSCTTLNTRTMRADFAGDGKKRVSRLFEVVANKLNLPTTQPLGLLMAAGGATSQPASPGNTPLSEDHVKVVFDNTAVVLDGRTWRGEGAVDGGGDGDGDKEGYGEEWETDGDIASGAERGPARKKRRVGGGRAVVESRSSTVWKIRTGQWRLRVQAAVGGKSGVECVLVGVKLDAVSSELAMNEQRAFLGG